MTVSCGSKLDSIFDIFVAFWLQLSSKCYDLHLFMVTDIKVGWGKKIRKTVKMLDQSISYSSALLNYESLFQNILDFFIEEKVPELVDAPAEYEAQVNGSVCLPCKVKGQSEYASEKVLFYWSKDNSTIWSWPRYRVKMNRCLRIRGIIPSDAGSYVCNAHNVYGKTSVVRKLVVIGDERRDLPNAGDYNSS